MRRLAGASVLVIVAVLLGTTVAWAEAVVAKTYNTTTWLPTGARTLSGVTRLGPNEYLVVDQNIADTNPGTSGWTFAPVPSETASMLDVAGVDEPSGVDYDEDSDTLFITSDKSSGPFIRVVSDYKTTGPTTSDIITPTYGSFGTEDPAYDSTDGILYWLDDDEGTATLHWIDPFTELGHGSIPLDYELGEGVRWEALAIDDASGDLFLLSSRGFILYRITVDRTTGGKNETQMDVTVLDEVEGFGNVGGMGFDESSYDTNVNTLWVVSRTGAVVELIIDGSEPPPPPTTTTTSSTTPTTAPTTTSTTAATTTTTTPGQTTTTTTPGQTTTTTTPGGGGGGGGGPVGPSGFADITGSTHAADIQWLADQGITKGCNPPSNTLFCPNQSVTRGQMAAFLGRAFGYTNAGTGNYFVDTIGNTFKTDIDRLRVAGVTIGCNPPTNDRFCPDQEVTRGQMAAFLGRAFGYTNPGTGNYFVDTIGNTFKTDIDRLRVAGVTMGCNPPTNNRYCPDEPVTRAQMATFLRRGFSN